MPVSWPEMIMLLCIPMACGAILTAGPAPSPREYDVRIPVNATVTLAGTLSLPMGDGPHPAVILLAGGAPDDRDASIGDFAPFRIMAAALVRRGVAVLRFDDRGVGGSTGEIPWHYPLTELATDVTAAIRFLRQRERIDPQRIGLCGHCLGALLAARAAEEAAPIRFLVLLTPPATTGAEQWLAYRRLSESGKGKSGPEIEQALEVDRRFIAAIAQGADPQPFRQEMRTILQREYENRPEPALQGAGSFEDYFNGSDWAGLLSFGPTPFGRSNFAYDPAPAYRRVTVPTLVLLGGADTAIPPAIHQPLLERAFDRPGSSPADIRLIPGATHYFTTTMAASGMAFVPDFLHSVTDWICRQAGLPNTVTPDNR